jgi:hypothetical protein
MSSELMITRLSDLRRRNLMFRGAILGLALFLALLTIGPIAFYWQGAIALEAAALAALLTLAGAGMALVVADRLRQPHEALLALSLGTMLRMGVPLVSGLVIHLYGGPLANAGFLYYVLIFYPVTLAVGTTLSLPPRPQPVSRPAASSNARS